MTSPEENPVNNAYGWMPGPGTLMEPRSNGESGRIGMRYIGVPLVIGAIGVSSYLLGSHNGEPMLSLSANDTTSHVTAKTIYMAPIDVNCNALTVFDVAGSVIKFQANISGHDIPQVGAEVDFNKPSKVVLSSCEKDSSSYLKGIKIVKGTVDPATNYVRETVRIPIDSITSNVQFPTSNKTLEVNEYAGLKIGGGVMSVLSGGVQGLCTAVTLNKAQQACDDFSKHFDGFKRDLESKAISTSEDAVLKFVQQKGSKLNWENTKAMIRDSYVQKAIDQAGNAQIANDITVEYVDAQGNPTDTLPNFNSDVFDSLRSAGILERGDTKVDTSNFKIVNPKPYAAKYPVTAGPAATPTTGATR